MIPTQDDLDDHADQLNPNNDAYWQSRGSEERPYDQRDCLDPWYDDTDGFLFDWDH